MQINVYLSKTDIELGVNPTPITITETGDVLKEYGLKTYTFNGLKLYAFADDLANPKSELVLTTMSIPKYFDQNGQKDIHGLFILSVGLKDANVPRLSAKAFVDDKTIGQFGCPKRILKQPDQKSYFTFNHMRFYPFINTDFSTGYYVCDDGPVGKQPRLAWPNYDLTEEGVAIEYPVQFDATLNLYMTRSSRIEYADQPE
jgi:hypothetical protein